MGFNRIFLRKQKKINPFSKALVENTGIHLSTLGISDKTTQAKIIHDLMQETAAHFRRIQNAKTEDDLDVVFRTYSDNMKKHLINGGVTDSEKSDDFIMAFLNEVLHSGIQNMGDA